MLPEYSLFKEGPRPCLRGITYRPLWNVTAVGNTEPIRDFKQGIDKMIMFSRLKNEGPGETGK